MNARSPRAALFAAPLAALLALAGAARAHADAAVIPTASDEARPDVLDALVVEFEAELGAARTPVLTNAAARGRFSERVSSAPAQLTASELDALPQRSESAVRNLALGKYGAAREDLRVALEIADRGLEEISREEKRARGVVDACLFMVRAYLEGGNEKLAKEQVVRCRRMFPDTEPTSQQLHTPEVRALVKAADEELLHGPRASLSVESTPRGCAVRMNGKRMGTTPMRIDDLSVYEYRVQVECDPSGAARGRVYTVALKEGRNRLHVDVPFDTAVSTEAGLSLSYRTDAERDAYRLAHAEKLGALVGADELWLPSPELEAGRVRVDRVRIVGPGTGGAGAAREAEVLASVSADFSGDDTARRAVVREVTALLAAAKSGALHAGVFTEGEKWGAPSADAAATPTAASETPTRANALSSGWRVTGLALVLAGAGALGVGAVRHARRGTDADALQGIAASDAGYLAKQDAWLSGRTLPTVLSAAGGAAMTLGAALALPGGDGVPWWGWVSGAAGLGLGVVGAIQLASGGACDGDAAGVFSRACLDKEMQLGWGVVMVSGAVPLLSVPIIAALRGAEPVAAPVRVGAEVTRSGAVLNVGGVL